MGGKGGLTPQQQVQNIQAYGNAAEQQGASGVQNTNQQTQNNRPDQSNNFSSSQWTQGPNGQWSQSNSLNGTLGNTANNLEGQVGGPIGTGDQARNQAINASYGASEQLLQPQQQLATQQNDAQLAAQGLTPESAAGQQSMSNLATQQMGQNQQALNSAIANGTAAQQATYGENYQSAMAPLQELQGLQGLLGQSNFSQAGVAAPTNYLGAIEGANNYNLGQADQNNQAMGSALEGIGAAAGFISDERVKENIQRHPQHEVLPGVPAATFNYRNDPRKTPMMGVIAQDVEKRHPQLVHEKQGVKHVHPALAPFKL